MRSSVVATSFSWSLRDMTVARSIAPSGEDFDSLAKNWPCGTSPIPRNIMRHHIWLSPSRVVHVTALSGTMTTPLIVGTWIFV